MKSILDNDSIPTNDSGMKTRNSEVLADFVEYCRTHPTERFWQALRNWSDYSEVIVAPSDNAILQDTFHWEGKTRDTSKGE